MQHLMLGEKSLLIGDHLAQQLLAYAAAVSRSGGADTVTVRALNTDGNEVDAGLLLNAGTSLSTETSHSGLPEPDNSEVERYLEKKLAAEEFDAGTAFGLSD